MTALQRMEPGDPRAKAIEAMARGVRQRWLDEQRLDLEPAWEHLHDESKDSYLADARAALAALEQEGLVLTDTREAERLRCDFCGGAEGDFYRKALSKIAGEWHARGTDGVRFGCSCPEFAREALSSVPAEEEGSDA